MNGSGQTGIEDSQSMDNRRIREGIHYPDRRCGRIRRKDNARVFESQHGSQEGQAVTNGRIDLQGVCGEMEFEGERVSETIYGLECLKTCKCGRRPRMIHEYLRVG